MMNLTRLPGPNADLWDWQIHAACRGMDSDIFFHPDGQRGRARTEREHRAKAICQSCPVLKQCRAHALRVREPFGVWGGLTEDERQAIYRQRSSPAA